MRNVVSVALAATLLACGGSDTATGPTTSLTLSAPAGGLVPGQSAQLVATATSNGQPAGTDGLTYTSSAPGVATVSAQGLLVAVAPGGTTITARLRGATATLSVTVLQGGLVTPAGGTIRMTSGNVEVIVPPGAVTSETPIMLAAAPAPWVDPTLARGSVYQVGAEGTTFALPVTVRVRYTPSNAPYGLPQAALGLRRVAGTSWVDIRPSTVDSVGGSVTASLTQTGIVSVGRLVPTEPCTAAAHRQFDFWVGSWNMTNGAQSAGENFITSEPGGCAVFENYVTATNLSPGRSVSFYNPHTNRWYQTYIDAGGNMVLLGSTQVSDGSLVMDSPAQGQAWTRTSWTREAGGNVRQVISSTTNGGTSFNVVYDLVYRRK